MKQHAISVKRCRLSATLILLLLSTALLRAQYVSSYGFQSLSGTFTPITGGTVLSISVGNTDEGFYDAPLGFQFSYLGSLYTNCRPTTNGVLSFTASGNYFTSNDLSGTSTPLIAPFWDDLSMAGGTFTYKTDALGGGDSVFTAEWLNARWNYNASAAVISFQVKLYKNSGKIEYIYRQESGAINAGSASIGICNGASYGFQYISLDNTSAAPTASSTVNTTTLSAKPATGQVYSLTPTPTVVKLSPSGVGTSTATAGGTVTNGIPSMTIGVLAGTSPNPSIGDPGVVDLTGGLVMTGNYTVNFTGLTPNTKYYYRAYATANASTSYSAQDSFTTLVLVNSFPYAEDFESISDNGWSTDYVAEWVKGTPAKTYLTGAHSGSKCWVTRTTGNFTASSLSFSVTSPIMDFSAYATTPYVQFWHKYSNSDNNDGGVVEISINGGAWTQLDNVLGTGTNFNTTNSYAWYNNNTSFIHFSGLSTAYASASNGWLQSSTALTGAAGQSNVRIRFKMKSNGNLTTGEGWAIDDVTISGPSGAVLGGQSITGRGATQVTVNGTITANGGSAVTASGVVVSTAHNPVLGGGGVIAASTSPLVALGSYTASVTGLTPATKYYYRLYATNTTGNGYSVEDSFTTAPMISTFPYTENFDGASATDWSSDGTVNNWVIGAPAKTSISSAYSAPNAFVTKTTGTYDNNHNGYVLSPVFNFSALTQDPYFFFTHKFITEAAWDAGVVEMSINGGVWRRVDSTIGTASAYNTTVSKAWYNNSSSSGPISYYKFSGNSNTYSTQVSGWIKSMTVLTGAAGQGNVQLRFRFATDNSGTNQEGWAIDDIQVRAGLPGTVTTTSATSVASTTATLGGNVTSAGSSAVTGSGVVLATSNNPMLNGSGAIIVSTSPLVTSGAFTIAASGLVKGTKYYIKAFVINSTDTAYGSLDSFTTTSEPVVVTSPASAISGNVATLNGSISANGGAAVTTSGFVYSTSPDPLVGGSGVINLTTSPLVTSGAYNKSTSTVLTSGSKYYFRAYAVNSVGTGYGAQDSFVTVVNPVVANNGATGITNNFATLGGNIISNGGGTISFSGIVYSPFSNPVLGGTGVTNLLTSPVVTSGTYSQTTNALASGTKYYYRAYASNGWGLTYAAQDSFVTLSAPSISSTGSSSVNNNSATVSANIISDGGSAITASGFVYSSTSSVPAVGGTGVLSTVNSPVVTSGTYSASLIGLSSNTLYYCRPYATNAYGTSYGSVISFTTQGVPVLANWGSYNITANGGGTTGNITSNGGSAITASGFVYATTPNPVVGGSGVTINNTSPVVTSGAYSRSYTGLTPDTKYYYSAYATNAYGTGYSVQDSFTTAHLVSTFPYTQDFEGTSAQYWRPDNTQWVLGTPAKSQITSAHSGSKAWVTYTTASYDNYSYTAVMSPVFDFSSMTADPFISFWHNFNTEAVNDGCELDISFNGGQSWFKLENVIGTGATYNSPNSIGWYNGVISAFSGFAGWQGSSTSYAGHSGGWIQTEARLAGAAGQANVRLKFTFASDASTTTADGWAFDDVNVFEIPAPSVLASNVTLSGITAGSVTVNWNNGNGAQRIAVARPASATEVAPTDLTSYTANTVYGSGATTGTDNYVVYNGSAATSVTVTGLSMVTNYVFTVYEYNGNLMHAKYTVGASNSGTTLPVKLVGFTAKASGKQDAVLNWSTASELENKGFDLERSSDGEHFTKVAFVAGHGTTSDLHTYTYTDHHVFENASHVYYRLKQVDINNVVAYSKVVSVEQASATQSAMTVSPNPFSDKVMVQFNQQLSGNARVRICDISGKVVYEKEVYANAGANELALTDMDGLKAGIYFIRVNEGASLKLVKY